MVYSIALYWCNCRYYYWARIWVNIIVYSCHSYIYNSQVVYNIGIAFIYIILMVLLLCCCRWSVVNIIPIILTLNSLSILLSSSNYYDLWGWFWGVRQSNHKVKYIRTESNNRWIEYNYISDRIMMGRSKSGQLVVGIANRELYFILFLLLIHHVSKVQ